MTRKVIQMWKYSKQEEKFIMQNEKESPRMETQLMRAANNDIFFVKSAEQGKLEVVILNQASQNENFYDSYEISADDTVQTDITRTSRFRIFGEKRYYML